MDALKAQAIAARTYALKRALVGVTLGDTSSAQVYRFSHHPHEAGRQYLKQRVRFCSTTGCLLTVSIPLPTAG